VTSGEVLAVVLAAVISFTLAVVLVKAIDRLRRKDAESEAREILARAQRDSANRLKEAELEIKEKSIQQKAEGEKDLSRLRQELHERERQLDKRHDSLEQQQDHLRRQEKMVEGTQRKLAEKIEDTNRRNDELANLLDLQRQTLHQLSGLSREDATRRLLDMLESDLKHEAGAMILRHEKKLAETCEAKSREILLTAIQRYAAAHTAETTTSTVDIPSDEMKGRIIGREGRNIRAFEKATGVDVIIDDTPGVVIVSGFDTVRREIARAALTKLIADGRIHPSRIEELVAETQSEMEQNIQKYGEEASQEADVPGLHDKIVHLLGRLRFRTSYSQNVLRH
jgi:ribonuclease Y